MIRFLKNKYFITFLLLLSTMLLALYLSVPSIVKHIAASKAPGVRINGELDWQGVFSGKRITVKNISIDRDDAKGNIKEVSTIISWSFLYPTPTDIRINGGSIDVKMVSDKPKVSSKKSDKPSVLAQITQVQLDKISAAQYAWDDLKIRNFVANKIFVNKNSNEVLLATVNSAKFEEENLGTFYTKKISYIKDHGLDIASVKTKITLPFFGKSIVEVSNVELYQENPSVKAQKVSISNVGIFENVKVFRINKGFEISGELFSSSTKHIPDIDNFLLVFDEEYNKVKIKSTAGSLPNTIIKAEVKKPKVEGKASCQEWTNAIFNGDEKEEILKSLFKEGEISFSVELVPPRVSLEEECVTICSNPLVSQMKKSVWGYLAYRPNGKERFTRMIGRGVEWADISLMDPEVVQAFIQLEDPQFKEHDGILLPSVLAALKQNFKKDSFSVGGSTITQQLVKNAWLSRDKTILRKAKEAILTIAVDDCYTKDEILELYLNVVEFGPDVYGILNGAKYRFDKSFVDLTREEAFYLAGTLPRPKTAPPPGNLERTKRLIARLQENGYIK